MGCWLVLVPIDMALSSSRENRGAETEDSFSSIYLYTHHAGRPVPVPNRRADGKRAGIANYANANGQHLRKKMPWSLAGFIRSKLWRAKWIRRRKRRFRPNHRRRGRKEGLLRSLPRGRVGWNGGSVGCEYLLAPGWMVLKGAGSR